MSEDESEAPDLKSFRAVKPRAVRLSQESLVKMGYLSDAPRFPLVIEPNVENLNLARWAGSKREYIEEELLRHGAILFRGFNVDSLDAFEQFARAISSELMEYGERSSPRTKLAEGIFTSTDHPADQHIFLHNEQSYTLNWPMKIWFYCVVPAQRGGRTPVASSRKIYKRIDPEIVEKFTRKQVMYVRNYGDGLGLPWQKVFLTDMRSEVEEHCRKAHIGFEWKSGGRLRTQQVRPAVRLHPKTHEPVWFNHAVFFHFSSLEAEARESILNVVDEEDVPYNTFYGDGSPIEPSVLDALRKAYTDEAVAFSWRTGDILMLDNMLAAHGREPFAGPRKTVVAMAEPFDAGHDS